MRCLFERNSQVIIVTAALGLSACGGNMSSSPSPAPPPVATAPDFSSVTAEIQRHPIADMALVIGDADGVLLSFEKGDLSVGEPLRVASASKLLTGLAAWSLVESGEMSEDMKPIDIIDGWPGEAASEAVTLRDLMSFTSGYNAQPLDSTCAGRITISLENCVFEISRDGLDTPPGQGFAYGPEHMQITAQMAKSVTGQNLSATLRLNILDNVGASHQTGFPASENTRYSGNAIATTEDYGQVLRGVLSGQIISDLDDFLEDRTDGTESIYSPFDDNDVSYNWHYGFGFWIECDVVPFNEDCTVNPTISSAGARGFVPWIDFDTGYWAIIAMESSGEAKRSTELQQILQPMIEAALAP